MLFFIFSKSKNLFKIKKKKKETGGGGGGGSGMGAVLADLKKGSAITSGLKKVTSDMKNKNKPLSERLKHFII